MFFSRGYKCCNFPNDILIIFSIAGLIVLNPRGKLQEPIFSSYLKLRLDKLPPFIPEYEPADKTFRITRNARKCLLAAMLQVVFEKSHKNITHKCYIWLKEVQNSRLEIIKRHM